MSNCQCPACRGRLTKWTTTPPGWTDSNAGNSTLPDLPSHLLNQAQAGGNDLTQQCQVEPNLMANGVFVWTENSGAGHAFLSLHRQGKVTAEKKNAPGKALWLLADACAMRLLPNSDNRKQPFVSTITHLGWRTVGPDDFTDADLDFFALVVEATDNPWLKARLADMLWVRKHNGGFRMALTALDNYRLIPVQWSWSQIEANFKCSRATIAKVARGMRMQSDAV